MRALLPWSPESLCSVFPKELTVDPGLLCKAAGRRYADAERGMASIKSSHSDKKGRPLWGVPFYLLFGIVTVTGASPKLRVLR